MCIFPEEWQRRKGKGNRIARLQNPALEWDCSQVLSDARHSGLQQCNCIACGCLSSLSGFARELILIAVNGSNVGGKWWSTPAKLTTSAQPPWPHLSSHSYTCFTLTVLLARVNLVTEKLQEYRAFHPNKSSYMKFPAALGGQDNSWSRAFRNSSIISLACKCH